MGEAWNPPFGAQNCAMVLFLVRLAIRQSGSLQLERARGFAEVAAYAGRGWKRRERGKKWVLIFTLPLGSSFSCGLV